MCIVKAFTFIFYILCACILHLTFNPILCHIYIEVGWQGYGGGGKRPSQSVRFECVIHCQVPPKLFLKLKIDVKSVYLWVSTVLCDKMSITNDEVLSMCTFTQKIYYNVRRCVFAARVTNQTSHHSVGSAVSLEKLYVLCYNVYIFFSHIHALHNRYIYFFTLNLYQTKIMLIATCFAFPIISIVWQNMSFETRYKCMEFCNYTEVYIYGLQRNI